MLGFYLALVLELPWGSDFYLRRKSHQVYLRHGNCQSLMSKWRGKHNTTLKSVAKDSDSDPETCSSSALFCLITLIIIKPEMEFVFLLKTNEISLDLQKSRILEEPMFHFKNEFFFFISFKEIISSNSSRVSFQSP